MPVLGHAFVGWATGLVWQRRVARAATLPRLVPAAVILAYTPDVATVLASPLWAEARRACHSVLLGPLLALLVAVPTARVLGTRFQSAAPLALLSIWFHDVLDLFQGTDRQPLWPLSGRDFGLDLFPSGLMWEGIGFGLLWVIAHRALGPSPPASRVGWSGATPAGAAIVIAILAVAAATAHLRDLREEQLEAARRAYAAGDNTRTLELLDLAERWPSTARPGRIDTLRGDACLELGDRRLARELYLAASDADPSYFWAVAGLALLEARGEGSSGARRSRAAPYVERLERQFARHAALRRVRAELERELGR